MFDDACEVALPALIPLYWTLVTFASTVALFPLPFASGFRNAVLLSACRGKLMDFKSSSALGPLSDWTVPQRWFAHFYLVGASWNAIVIRLFLASPFARSFNATSVALGLFEIHLVRRLIETVGLMRYPQGARMHGIAYVFGLSYYLVVPLTILPSASYPSICHLISSERIKLAAATVDLSSQWHHLSAIQLMGIAIFLGGNLLQLHSHWILAHLGGGSKYRIPRGGAFELVSCPHYSAEIVIYVGLAILQSTENALPWLMVLWVVSNLSLAAGLTQKWYLSHFKTYPRRRKALIPYLY